MKAKTKSSEWVGSFPLDIVFYGRKLECIIDQFALAVFAPKTHLWFVSLHVNRILSQITNTEQIRK